MASRKKTVAATLAVRPTNLTVVQAQQSRQRRWDPLPTLTPQRLVQYLQQFDYGYLANAARMWDAMERRDDRLMAVVPKAKSALTRYGYEIIVPDDVGEAHKTEAAAHKAVLDYFFGNLTAVNAVDENEQGGFSLFARQKADAIGKKYSVHEIVWQPGTAGLTATFRHAPLWFFENTTGRLRFLPQEGGGEGVPMDPQEWHVTVGLGLMEACSVLYLYKHFPLQDWLGYCEKFGFPAVLGKTDAPLNSPGWMAMQTAVGSFNNDFGAVVSTGDDIGLIERKGGGEKTPFEGLIERSDRAMSILWRGADLGTQSHQGTGQGQGASLQSDETDKLDSDRATWLGESLIGLSRQVIEYTFGVGVHPLAYLRVKTEVKRDVQLDIQVDEFLLANGAPIGVDESLERYGRAHPPKDAELLKPVPAAAAAEVDADKTEATLERAANELRRRADETEAQLLDATAKDQAKAKLADFSPLQERWEAIGQITDPEMQRAALIKLNRDLPALLHRVNRDPQAARALANGMASGFVNGAVDAELQTQKSEQTP